MACPRCRHETPADAAFCPECGARLAPTCPQCGTASAPGYKFCKACGEPLATAGSGGGQSERFTTPQVHIPKHLAERILTSKAALEGERKQVTVLFADLKGSLELLGDRDPEEARAILDPVVERMMEAVHRYEGTVNQVMGDGIMALFGAPLGHEDHAVRACYAALDMQAAIRRYTGEARRAHGIEVQIRVGLNSGEVVVRTIGSDLHMDYSAIGQTTHLASRMEQLATPGTIRLTAHTLHLVEGFVEVKPLGLVPVKGLEAPIEVYELVGAGPRRSRLEAAAARGLTRFVGRSRELEELRGVLGQAAEGHGQVVAIVGEPGVGKSRLVWEVTHSHRTHGWLIVQAGSVSYGKATLYLPFVDLLKEYFQIQDRHEHREIREKVIGKLLALDEALRPTLPAFLGLLDVPVDDPEWHALDPSQRRLRTLEATKRLLLRESQAQPLLVVFEDLHWIDTETQALLDTLVESLPSARVVLLVNYRPEYQHGWASKTYYTQIRLDPLPQESTEEFLNALLGTDPGLRSLGSQLMGRTQGNPFFLEESVRTLVETGVLAGEPGAYRLEKTFQPTLVPATVQAVLAARIDRLPPEEKYLLQAASVIGTDVPFALLQAVADLPDAALGRGLDHLQTAEFVYEKGLFPDLEYTFKHALTHEVVYRGLLQDRRSALHARVVTAFEAMHADRLGPHVERVAHHAVQGRLWERAVRYLRESGIKAAARSAHREAIEFFEEALEVVGRLPESPSTLGDALDIRIALGPSLIALLGAPAAQVETSYRHADELCDRRSDTARRFPVRWGLWYSAFAQGRYPTACELGESLLELANASGDSGQLLEAHHALWATFNAMGRPAVTLTHLERGLALYDRQQHDQHALSYGGHDAGACCHSHLGFTWWLLGYPEKALRHTRAAISLAKQLSHTLTTVITLGYGGLVYWLLADHRAAAEAAQSVVTLCEQKGLPGFSLDSEVLLARAQLERSGSSSALDALKHRLHTARHARAASRHTFCACLLAEAYGRTGQPGKGLELLASLGPEQRAALFAPEVHRLEGELLAQSGAQARGEAEGKFRQAIDLARERSELSLELRAAMSLARLLGGNARRRVEGRAILAHVYERFTEGLGIGDLPRARVLLEGSDELGSSRGSEAQGPPSRWP
jgi:class 3 adenylate cyclase/predicted ATPase